MATSKRQRAEKTRLIISEPDAIDSLCDHIYEGGTLTSFCLRHDIKYRVVQFWLLSDEERSKKYEAALKSRDSVIADGITEALREISALDVRQAFDPKGNLLPVAQLPPALARSIASIDVTTNEGGEITTKLRFDSRTRTLEMLGRSVGMFREKVEVTGKDGAPLSQGFTAAQLAALSDDEFAALSVAVAKMQKASDKGGHD